MVDAYTLVVLTLLQLCRGEIAEPEWYAANLVNEPAYTPKPITEIFTSDSPFPPKNPALFTQPTISTLPPNSKATLFRNVNLPPIEIGESPIHKMPEIMSQVVEGLPKNELPNFLIVFDPRAQGNSKIQPPITSSIPPTTSQATKTAAQQTQPAAASDTSFAMQSTPAPLIQGTLPPFQPGIAPQTLSTISPLGWPVGSMLAYPVQFPSISPVASSSVSPLTLTATAIPTQQPIRPPSLNGLTVRVKAPKGSTTNIRIKLSTSTARPSTTRRRKSNKRNVNDYDRCTKSCNGRREPICSSPLGVRPINSDNLKGFPSVCHMGCHNSFKRDQKYEKVANGRCGRLRTRIRSDDKKLNREELKKAQYTLVHNAPETVFEFSPVRQ